MTAREAKETMQLNLPKEQPKNTFELIEWRAHKKAIEALTLLEKQEAGLVVELPTWEQLLEKDILCGFCRAAGCRKITLTPTGPDFGCEGRFCKEAYDSYLDNAYDAMGIPFPEPAAEATKEDESCE